jgi:hypothetical protein
MSAGRPAQAAPKGTPMDTLARIAVEIGRMLYQAGVYVVIGVAAAGLVHVFVSRALMARHLGGRGFRSVAMAALLGAPLPLCSCSVLPTAFALRRKGAGRGATVSFLISTPETSLDSVAVTWALMGPLMAIMRPVAAVLTALVAGLLELVRSRRLPEPAPEPDAEPVCEHCATGEGEHVEPPGRWRRFWRFTALDLGDEIGPTLALGLLVAGIIGAVVPKEFFERYLGSPLASMLVMLAVGLPLYVCATASTPMAAMMVLRGLNPGAALVFLLVGPATNVATVLTVARMFGKLSAVLYVATIAACSLVFGFALDAFVGAWQTDVSAVHAHEALPAPVHWAGAAVLGIWLLVSLGRWVRRKVARTGPPGSPRPAAEPCCGTEDD